MNIFLPLMVATLAPITNCIQMAPQLYKTYKTKSAKDISIYSVSIILVNALLWAMHGYFIMDTSLLVASAIAFTINLLLFILVMGNQKT